jgi:hypothetical protein
MELYLKAHWMGLGCLCGSFYADVSTTACTASSSSDIHELQTATNLEGRKWWWPNWSRPPIPSMCVGETEESHENPHLGQTVPRLGFEWSTSRIQAQSIITALICSVAWDLKDINFSLKANFCEYTVCFNTKDIIIFFYRSQSKYSSS